MDGVSYRAVEMGDGKRRRVGMAKTLLPVRMRAGGARKLTERVQ